MAGTIDTKYAALTAKYGAGSLVDLERRYWADIGLPQPPWGEARLDLIGRGRDYAENQRRFWERFVTQSTLGIWFEPSVRRPVTAIGAHPQKFVNMASPAAWELTETGGGPTLNYDGGILAVDQTVGGGGLYNTPAGTAFSNNVTGITVIAVCKPSNATSSQTLFGISTAAVTNSRFRISVGGNTATKISVGTRRLDADALAQLDAPSAYSTNWQIITAAQDYTNALAKVRVNGTQNLAPTANGTAGNTEATNASRLATANLDLTNAFLGKWACIMAFESYLADANCLALERWLGDRFGITTP